MNLDQLQVDADAISKSSPAIRKFAEDTVAYLRAQAASPAPAPAPAPQPTPSPSTDPYSAFKPVNTRGIFLIAQGDVDFSGWQNINQYDFVGGNAALLSTGQANPRIAAAQPGVSFLYVEAIAALAAYNESVDYQQAKTNGWLATTSSGAPIGVTPNQSSAEALLLVDNPGLQAQVVSNCKQMAALYPGLKGFIFDNVCFDYTAMTGAYQQYVASAYGSQAAWQAALLNYLANVGGALRAAGFFVIVNMTSYAAGQPGWFDGTFYQQWIKTIAGSAGVDAVSLETWMQDPNNLGQLRVTGSSPNPCYFDGWMALTDAANAARVHFMPTMRGSQANTQAMRYSKGSFLLGWDGVHGGVWFDMGVGVDPWNAAWTQDIGTPTAARVKNANGTYFRQYTGGWVGVNPTLSAQTVNGVTVAATDAIIHAG